MPPPIPLSGASCWYRSGSHSGSAISSVKSGSIDPQASAAEADRSIAARTLADEAADQRRVEEPLVVLERLESVLIENVAHRYQGPYVSLLASRSAPT